MMHSIDHIAAVLPPADRPMTLKQIHARVGMWAPTTIKLMLLRLIQAGHATRTSDYPPRFSIAQHRPPLAAHTTADVALRPPAMRTAVTHSVAAAAAADGSRAQMPSQGGAHCRPSGFYEREV